MVKCKILSLTLMSFLIISPIWPLGKNPLPGDPFIIVNKQSNELAFINNNELVFVSKVATGRLPTLTPEGLFTVTVKAKQPYYRKENITGGARHNPLGSRWIGIDALQTDGRVYGIHGTNRPDQIGEFVTNGCVRLTNEVVNALYELVPLGTKVLIVHSQANFTELATDFGALSNSS